MLFLTTNNRAGGGLVHTVRSVRVSNPQRLVHQHWKQIQITQSVNAMEDKHNMQNGPRNNLKIEVLKPRDGFHEPIDLHVNDYALQTP